GHEVELVDIVTEGDTNRASLASLGGTGVFATALRDALIAGEIDLAVHSLKDLPTAPAPGLVVAAIPQRADSRDPLCARDGLPLGELGADAAAGTGAPRRRSRHGALGTRPPLVGPGDDQRDAVVLAAAGLTRAGLQERVTEYLDPIQLLPAPGQGALAVECCEGNERVLAALRALDHEDTRSAVTAE